MKKKDNSFRVAAAVFGVSVAAAVLMFALSRNSGGDTEEDNYTVFSDMEISETDESDETKVIPAQVTEVTEKRNFVVTADTEDIISEEAASAATLPDTEEDADVSYPEEGTAEPAVTDPPAVITSRERSEFDGVSVYISMDNILQNPELPVGCEITALTILLNYWGFNAEKCDMARNYLPVSSGRYKYEDGKTYKDSFYDFFIGDPFSRGYGCFAHAIEKAANKYINDHGGGYTVYNISGCSPDTLYSYVKQDIPVLVWATDGMIEPEYYETWYDIDTGEQLDWYLNEHCAVLAGFDIDNNTVTLNDPMKGIKDYNIDRFETRFQQMHSQAIVIIPDDSSANEETETETETVTETETETVTETEEYTEETEQSEYTDTENDYVIELYPDDPETDAEGSGDREELEINDEE